MSQRRIVDLSHPIHSHMLTHPGIPNPTIQPFLTRQESSGNYAPGVSFEMTCIYMVTSIGTYVDSPAHRFAGAPDLSEVPLERYVDLPGVVVDAGGARGGIGPEAFAGLSLSGRAVLVKTGWDCRWDTPAYWEPSPFLTADACRLIIDEGAALVGVDFGNVDDRSDLTRPAHSLLLAARLGVVENLRRLDALPTEGFRFHAAPLAVRGGMVIPVRAYACLDH